MNKLSLVSGVAIGLVASKIYNKLTKVIVKKAYEVIKDGKGLVFDTRSDAQEIADKLYELIETYGSVSVADYYELVDIVSDYTDNNIGWTSLKGMTISRLSIGYTLIMPNTISLK